MAAPRATPRRRPRSLEVIAFGALLASCASSKAAHDLPAPKGPVATLAAFRHELAELSRLAPPTYARPVASAATSPNEWLRTTLTPYFERAEAQRARTHDAAARAVAAAPSAGDAHRIARDFALAWAPIADGVEAAAEPAFDAAFDDATTHALASAELARRLAPNRIAAFDDCAALAAPLVGTPAEDGTCAREAARLRERIAAADREVAAVVAAARATPPWIETTSPSPCVFAGSLRTVVAAEVFATRDAKAPVAVLAPSGGVVVTALDLANDAGERVEIRVARPFEGVFFVDRAAPWVELTTAVASADGAFELLPGASVHVRGIAATAARAATVSPLDAGALVTFAAGATATTPCSALRLAGSGTFGRSPVAAASAPSSRDADLRHVVKAGAALSRDRAGSRVLARVSDVNVAVLESTGARARVRATLAPLTVTGWVDEAALAAREAPYYALVNIEPLAVEGRPIEITRESGLSIYARASADARPITRISKGATVFVGRELPSGYIEIRLRDFREKDPTAPFVARAGDLLSLTK